jgi:hypothetical protein
MPLGAFSLLPESAARSHNAVAASKRSSFIRACRSMASNTLIHPPWANAAVRLSPLLKITIPMSALFVTRYVDRININRERQVMDQARNIRLKLTPAPGT